MMCDTCLTKLTNLACSSNYLRQRGMLCDQAHVVICEYVCICWYDNAETYGHIWMYFFHVNRFESTEKPVDLTHPGEWPRRGHF